MRLKNTNISVVGAEPGATYTWIIKNLNPIVLSFMAFASIFMKTPPQGLMRCCRSRLDSCCSGAATVVFACLDRRVAAKVKPFCANCHVLKLNMMRCRNPKLRKDLFEMSEELIRNAEFDSCQTEGFNPKLEASMSHLLLD